MNVRVRKIRPLAALKLVAGSATCFSFTICLFFGVLAIGGCHTIHVNGQPITGIWAFPYSVLLALMMAIVTTVIGWIALVVGSAMFQFIYPTDFECEASDEESPDSHTKAAERQVSGDTR